MTRTGTRLCIAAVALLLFVNGCAMTSSYDPRFDRDLTGLRDELDAFLVSLEATAGTPAGTWAEHEAFYDGLWASFEGLRQRAEAKDSNGPTVLSLSALGQNLHRLESLHRQGVTKEEVSVLRKILCPQLDALCELASAQGKE